jgi:hypothetical protein
MTTWSGPSEYADVEAKDEVDAAGEDMVDSQLDSRSTSGKQSGASKAKMMMSSLVRCGERSTARGTITTA